MVRVVFKNLKSSEFIKKTVDEKMSHVLEKFPEMQKDAVATITVEMESTMKHMGPDLFRVRLILLTKGLRPIVLEKEAASPYQAVALMTDRLFEVMHRALEKRRERVRAHRKKWKESRFVEHEWKNAS